jgi:hypothetical protein
MKSVSILLIITLLTSIFLVGVYVGSYKIFPYYFLDDIKEIIIDEKILSDSSVYPVPNQDNLKSILSINDVTDIQEKRQKLIEFIWKSEKLSYELIPTNIQKNIVTEEFEKLNNLQQIDKLTIEMEFGVNSISYLFIPDSSNEKLVIYHQGHGGGFENGKKTIEVFLNEGYHVLAFSMPLKGYNSQPELEDTDFGRIKLINHNSFRLIEDETFSPIKFFFHPIFVSLNYLEQEFNFDSYHMIGLSGGGWTTVVYSAIDERVSKSFPVAGTFPISLRTEPQNFGDYEQTLPDLYRTVNYLELYIMGSYGEGRSQLQIFNKYDPCCFSGNNYVYYEEIIKNKIAELNHGKFSIFSDDTHREHQISENSLKQILEELKL